MHSPLIGLDELAVEVGVMDGTQVRDDKITCHPFTSTSFSSMVIVLWILQSRA